MKNKKLLLPRTIFLVSAISGLLAVFIFRRNLSAELSLFNYFGLLPNSLDLKIITFDKLSLIFNISPLLGLALFNFFDLINIVLIFILFFPIYSLIYNKGQKIILLILFFSLLSIILYYFSNNSLYYLFNYNVSDYYVKQEIINKLNNQIYKLLQTIGLFLFYFSGLILSIFIKKINLFSKYSFLFGIFANIIGLSYFLLFFIIPDIAYFSIVFSAPFTVIWHTNLSLNLFKIWKQTKYSN